MIKQMIEWTRLHFALPSPEKIALMELEDAQRKLLSAQSAKEYAESMTKYHEARIKRLTVFLNTATKETT